jgi:hypothetical protein
LHAFLKYAIGKNKKTAQGRLKFYEACVVL